VTFRGYKHFVLDQNKKAVEDEYFKRAVRQRDHLIVDINRDCKSTSFSLNPPSFLAHLWYLNKDESSYGNTENISLLAVAYKAIYANEALLGVVGIEFTYDNLVDHMKKFGCAAKVKLFI
jgi:hypothetical protein